MLRNDLNTIGVLDTLKRRLNLLNVEKQKLLNFMALSYSAESKLAEINR